MRLWCLVHGTRFSFSIVFGVFMGMFIGAIYLPVYNGNSGRSSCEFAVNDVTSLAQTEADTYANSERRLKFVPNVAQAEPELLPKQSQCTHNTSQSKTYGQTKRSIRANRPRFAATELGIKDKLFVGILTSRVTVHTLAVALNRTIAQHSNKVIFFIDGSHSESLPGPINLVGFHDVPPDLLLLHIIEYIGRQVVHNYDWFYLAPDRVYVKAFKLHEVVSHLSIGCNAVLGRLWPKQSKYCNWNAGILISNQVMQRLVAAFPKCKQQLQWKNLDHSAILGQCLELAGDESDFVCREEFAGKLYRTWQIPDPQDLTTNFVESWSTNDSFINALTVFPVTRATDMLQLNYFFSNLEMDQMRLLIDEIEDVELRQAAADFPDDFSWPHGSPKPWSTKSRFEVFKWDFFTQDTMFEGASASNKHTLVDAQSAGVEKAFNLALQKLTNKTSTEHLTQFRLLGGYRNFDPTRGMDYILDVEYSTDGMFVTKRVRVAIPLNRAEIVPMPYVTEAAQVTVVLPVMPYELDAARQFVDQYKSSCLNTGENARLIVVTLYMTVADQNSFAVFLQELNSLREKYTAERKLPQHHLIDHLGLRIAYRSPFRVMDLIVERFGSQVLYFLAVPSLDIRTDFLNRVRMNTIESVQVFFPIPFVQFRPDIVNRGVDRAKWVTHVEVHKKLGHFDAQNFDVASFYGTDYLKHRPSVGNVQTNEDKVHRCDMVTMFLVSSLSVMRATDPALKLRYADKVCDPLVPEDWYARCLLSRGEGLASKAQLAALVLNLRPPEKG